MPYANIMTLKQIRAIALSQRKFFKPESAVVILADKENQLKEIELIRQKGPAEWIAWMEAPGRQKSKADQLKDERVKTVEPSNSPDDSEDLVVASTWNPTTKNLRDTGKLDLGMEFLKAMQTSRLFDAFSFSRGKLTLEEVRHLAPTTVSNLLHKCCNGGVRQKAEFPTPKQTRGQLDTPKHPA